MIKAPRDRSSLWTSVLRDSAFGSLVRLATKGKYFRFLDERNPELWKEYVNQKKSGHLAHHGTAEPDEDGDGASLQGIGGVRTREGRGFDTEKDGELESEKDRDSSEGSPDAKRRLSKEEGTEYNRASGIKLDPEKGRDLHLIDWLDDDPEVCLLKSFVDFAC